MTESSRFRRPGLGPLAGKLPTPLISLCAWVYSRIIGSRNRAFDARRGVVEFDRPVISVGNLSVGGTGKSPMVQRVVTLLQGAGLKPVIAMRGYGAAPGDAASADEVASHARALRHVPIVARPDRTRGLIELFGTEPGAHLDCIVLDDGFQHRQIARQVDLVLLDATCDAFADRLLPAGWLREPVESLSRASAVIITHAERVSPAAIDAMLAQATSSAPHAVLAVCEHAWTALTVRIGEESFGESSQWLKGKRVVVTCAIGNPGAFLDAARESGAQIVGELVRNDHDPYGESAVHALLDLASSSRAEAVLMTDKDWSKLSRVEPSRWPCATVVPTLSLLFRRGEAELDAMILNTVRRVHAEMEAEDEQERQSAPIPATNFNPSPPHPTP